LINYKQTELFVPEIDVTQERPGPK